MRRIKRRIGMLLLLGAVIWSCSRDKRDELIEINPSYIPHEGTSHQKTWISFSGSQAVKQNLILVASTIAQYEPVAIVVNEKEQTRLKKLLGNLKTHHYPIEVFQSKVHTSWIRDEGPTFVYDEKESLWGIDFNYNHLHNDKKTVDTNLTQFIVSKSSAALSPSNLVVKTTCIDVDGAGTAIITEQCIINDTLNPYWEKEEIEAELKVLLDLQKIIWLKGLVSEKNNVLHTSLYARFIREGVILVHRNNNKSSDEYTLSRENITLLQTEKDAQEHPLKMIIIDGPEESDVDYLGYYLCNNALIMQTFGDHEADYKAHKTFQLAFPERTIEEVQIDAISAEGGDVHSVTLQEPAL